MHDPPRARDDPSHTYDLTSPVYAIFPPHAPDTPSPAPSTIRRPHAKTSKRKDTDPSINLTPTTSNLPQRLQTHQNKMDLHQTTCLNLNTATESLSDFDDWEIEIETESTPQISTKREGLLRRAASSNRERLRARLEGDGWDFVGGKYGGEEGASRNGNGNGNRNRGESVDEEFGAVMVLGLGVGRVGC